MSELIVIDVAIFAFLIMIATVIVVSRGRRSNRRFSAPRDAAAEPAGAGPDPRAMPITPGLRADDEEPDPGAYERAEPEQPEPEQAEAAQAGPEQPEPEQAAPPQVSEVAVAEPGRNGSAPKPGGRPDDAGAAVGGGQIGSYYEGADRAIADYLASRGWPQEPGTRDPAGHA